MMIRSKTTLKHTGGGSDADKTGDHALNGADDGGFVEEDDVKPSPH